MQKVKGILKSPLNFQKKQSIYMFMVDWGNPAQLFCAKIY